MKTVSAAAVFIFSLVQFGSAQVHGLGFTQGKVVDEKGTAMTNVTFTAVLPRVGGRIVGTSDAHGEWKIIGMAHGEWDIAFTKPGYATSRAKVVLEPELARIPPLTIKLKADTSAPGAVDAR